MNAFKRWGVTADWTNAYITMNKHYVSRELKIFAELYDRNLVHRDFMPVYWFVLYNYESQSVSALSSKKKFILDHLLLIHY